MFLPVALDIDPQFVPKVNDLVYPMRVESKWGRQLEKKIDVVSHESSAWVNTWILPPRNLKLTSNKLLVFNEKKEGDGWRVSWAQAMRTLSPGCLPCILPRRHNYALVAQVEHNVANNASGIVATSLRVTFCCVVSTGLVPLDGLSSMMMCCGCKGGEGNVYFGWILQPSCWFWRGGLSYLRVWSTTMGANWGIDVLQLGLHHLLLRVVWASNVPPPSACVWKLQMGGVDVQWKRKSITSPMIVLSILDTSLCTINLSRTSPWGVPRTSRAQGGPQSDTRDLWRRWWEGPSDLSVGEGPGRWECLPPTETRRHEGKAMNYA